jgi:hypothetical protein
VLNLGVETVDRVKLAGAFVTTADDVLNLCFDGSNFFETGRSVN